MPGVVFLICVPTAIYELELEKGFNFENNEKPNDNLNITLPENMLRLEVELRDKNARHKKFPSPITPLVGGTMTTTTTTLSSSSHPITNRLQQQHHHHHHQLQQLPKNHKDELINNCIVPMEKVLEELLKKLNIDNVIWHKDTLGHFYQVVFPLQSGDPCETTLHCLTELGIGSKLFSNISVMPCSVSYDALKDNLNDELYRNSEDESKWNNFVESIKSKLTVKQVVDGVRAGGSLSFDYLLLIVTADSLAALGLVENNASNIVAAMLVSPLMGPVMSITFGTIISDRELVKVGFISLALGMFISMLFGFIFGLILGTTEMPWGFGDWPTEEMKGRGNARSLWMGVLWALTSGTGVAVALLQGSAGPLIGVAISASLLPPVVNCGLFWALACIWLIYDGPNQKIKIPHIKGEPYMGNSTYQPIYTNYIPTEFLINGIVSALLTVVNVICIFITAIIILKIKEVAAPYTASPDLRRFWETDIRTVRKTNRSTIRRKNTLRRMSRYEDITNEPRNRNLETALEQALKEASDDETFRKVKRMSYSSNAVDEVTRGLSNFGGHHSTIPGGVNHLLSSTNGNSEKMKTDLEALEKLITTLLEHHQVPSENRSSILNKLHPRSRSLRHGSMSRQHHHHPQTTTTTNLSSSTMAAASTIQSNFDNTGNLIGQSLTSGSGQTIQSPSLAQQQAAAAAAGGGNPSTMPTILETNNRTSMTDNNDSNVTATTVTTPVMRRVLNSIVNVPNRLSRNLSIGRGVGGGTTTAQDEENINLTENILD